MTPCLQSLRLQFVYIALVVYKCSPVRFYYAVKLAAVPGHHISCLGDQDIDDT